jgi:hypothetical protein
VYQSVLKCAYQGKNEFKNLLSLISYTILTIPGVLLMEKKKLVLPGDHLFSTEEAVSGENTYEENDEIFSAGFGEGMLSGGAAEVTGKGRKFTKPYEGMDVYCLVTKAVSWASRQCFL